MSFTMSRTEGTPVAAEGPTASFNPPGPGSFDAAAEFPRSTAIGVTKPMLLLVLSAVLVFAFYYWPPASAPMVPGRLQFAGETGYGFVRNTLARDNIGSHDFMRFVPYLFVAVLLHPGEQLLRHLPVPPVPDVLAHRVAYRWRS